MNEKQYIIEESGSRKTVTQDEYAKTINSPDVMVENTTNESGDEVSKIKRRIYG